MAREALQGHFDVSRDFGDPIPAPLNLEAAKAHKDSKGAEFFLAVAVQVESGKASRLIITMPVDTVEEVDAYDSVEAPFLRRQPTRPCTPDSESGGFGGA